MKLFNEFENNVLGSYDIILHASKDEAKEIMTHFGYKILPDLLPGQDCKYHEDLYMFLIDSKNKVISPVWSHSYVYGSQYGGYPPVGYDLGEIEFNIEDYIMDYFNKWDRKLIEYCERSAWPDITGPIYRK